MHLHSTTDHIRGDAIPLQGFGLWPLTSCGSSYNKCPFYLCLCCDLLIWDIVEWHTHDLTWRHKHCLSIQGKTHLHNCRQWKLSIIQRPPELWQWLKLFVSQSPGALTNRMWCGGRGDRGDGGTYSKALTPGLCTHLLLPASYKYPATTFTHHTHSAPGVDKTKDHSTR